MNNRVMEKLEILEDEIENLKWLVVMPLSLKKADISNAVNAIRKSSGILGKVNSFARKEEFLLHETKRSVLLRFLLVVAVFVSYFVFVSLKYVPSPVCSFL